MFHCEAPLVGRDMLLEGRFLVLRFPMGVRVDAEIDETRARADGTSERVWGWSYRTLEGHVEKGQMHWEVWKWPDTGAVEFRVHAVSRPAPIRNPVIWIGFRALRRHERRLFLDSTERRMRELTAAALRTAQPDDAIRAASPALTARRLDRKDPGHERLAQRAGRPRT
jgi:hypothetical protein